MSNSRNTVVRSMHDLGMAAWFGGSLMGAVGLNGATKPTLDNPRPDNPLAVAASGWARWSPVAAAAIGVHLIGGVGLILGNRGRIVGQQGAGANAAVKAGLTVAAMATTAYSGVLGAHLATQADSHVESATVPSGSTPDKVARSQQQLRVLQWATPVLIGVLIILGAQQGEQQKPAEIAKGVATKALRRARRS